MEKSKLGEAKRYLEDAADSFFAAQSLEVDEGKALQGGNSNPLKAIARDREIIKTIICLIIIKFAFYIFYYGVMSSVERTGFNAGVSIFLIGSSELAGYNFNSGFIQRMRRKTLLYSSNIIKGTIGLTLIIPFIK